MRWTLTSALALGFAAACTPSSTVEVDEAVSEPTTEAVIETVAWTKGGMAAAADPRAVQAAVEILEQGGHAVDAAIAAHAVLGLVEPQSSGIGGGAFMVVYDRAADTLVVYDGRETAPAAVTPDNFMEDGEVLNFIESWQSGRSIGVPGQIALYEAAHADYGQVEWASVFDAAISLAENGFEVSPRLSEILSSPRLRQFIQLDDRPDTGAYFYPEGEPLQVGQVRDNPDYAATLRAVATNGAEAFYTGEIAEAIVASATAGPRGSSMTLEDLANYEVIKRDALCGTFRVYRICSAPPPSSGGVAQNMIMGLYERMRDGLSDEEATDETMLQIFVDAQRLAYADRDHYLADPDFVTVPTEDLIHPDYLDVRATERFAPDAPSVPGDPGAVLRTEPMIDMWGRDTTDDQPGTTHLSVIDVYGNAVSMTATVEAPFGSSYWANGFLLNNELTDFARDPMKNGQPVANAPEGGKRPRSSMSPTIVFDEAGDLLMVTGSPGGNSIIAYVAKTLVGVLDWGKTAQEAIDLPNVIARGDTIGVETGRDGGTEIEATLTALGYEVEEGQGEGSGLHVIVVREDGLEGGADPRREGVAIAVSAATLAE